MLWLMEWDRFHNHVVEQLAVINESGRFTKPREGLSEEMAEKAWAKYDNDLFQTGRLWVSFRELLLSLSLSDFSIASLAAFT